MQILYKCSSSYFSLQVNRHYRLKSSSKIEWKKMVEVIISKLNSMVLANSSNQHTEMYKEHTKVDIYIRSSILFSL